MEPLHKFAGLIPRIFIFIALPLLTGGCARLPYIDGAAATIPCPVAPGKWDVTGLDMTGSDSKSQIKCSSSKSALNAYDVYAAKQLHHQLEFIGVLHFYRIGAKTWIELANPNAAKPEGPIVGTLIFFGPDRARCHLLSPIWVHDYAVAHPSVLPYREDPNDKSSIIVTVSPTRWVSFLAEHSMPPEAFVTYTLHRSR